MLNNFCFHVYAQKSLFIGENDNVYLTNFSKFDTVNIARKKLSISKNGDVQIRLVTILLT